jgi:hypothetical protein
MVGECSRGNHLAPCQGIKRERGLRAIIPFRDAPHHDQRPLSRPHFLKVKQSPKSVMDWGTKTLTPGIWGALTQTIVFMKEQTKMKFYKYMSSQTKLS